MRKAEAVAYLAAAAIGPLTAHSTDLWLSMADLGRAEIAEARHELLASAGLSDLHHEVHARVGEAAWESRVKPEFLRAITVETARDTGYPFPSWRDVVRWVRAHPEDARRLLRRAAVDEK